MTEIAFEGQANIAKHLQDIIDEGRPVPSDSRRSSLLPLNAPAMDHATRACLLTLIRPNVQTMIDTLRSVNNDPGEWLFPGSQFYEHKELDLLAMNDALCKHPDTLLHDFLISLTMEYYPRIQFYVLVTYFFKSRTPEGEYLYYERDLHLFYVLVRYVTGGDQEANTIAEALHLSTQIVAVRARYLALKKKYAQQKAAVERLLKDVREYLKNPEAVPLPRWSDYIK